MSGLVAAALHPNISLMDFGKHKNREKSSVSEDYLGTMIEGRALTYGAHTSSDLEHLHSADEGTTSASPKHAPSSFYTRSPGNQSEKGSEMRHQRACSEADSLMSDREFLFPVFEGGQRKLSLPEGSWRARQDSSLSSSPRLHHKPRSHSVSFTAPVSRSTYDSLPQSPATSFLAQFAEADNWQDRTILDDGSVVEKYTVGRVIGRGSFSECREGYFGGGGGEKVAMKVVRSSPDGEGGFADFEREVEIWRGLRHGNILTLLDFIQTDDARIAISPVAENGSMLDYIAQHGAFEEGEAKELFRQVAQAVSHMHGACGIVHRDIKLDNILLDSDLRPYLCDFGLSERLLPQEQAQEHRVKKIELQSPKGSPEPSPSSHKDRTEGEIFCKGSLWYLSPEEMEPSLSHSQQAGEGQDGTDLRTRADVWALGVVLYGMVTGKLPFCDDFLPRLQQSITLGKYPPLPEKCSTALRDLVGRMLTVEVERRPEIEMVLQHPWLLG